LIGGGVITFFITKYFRERKSLGYQIISKMSLVNVNPEVRDKIKIDYDGTSVENLFSFKVRVINNGNIPIKDQAILFEFDERAKVLVADYNTDPPKEFGEIERVAGVAANEAKFVIGLLNPKSKKEEVEFNLLTVDNENDDIEIHAKGENLRVREIPPRSDRIKTSFQIAITVFMIVAGVAMASGFFWKEFQQASSIPGLLIAISFPVVLISLIIFFVFWVRREVEK